jgi:hypothetical protein
LGSTEREGIMAMHLQALGTVGETHNLQFEAKPDRCPLCHHACDPVQLSAAILTGDPSATGTVLEIVFRCPRRDCLRMFVGRYTRRGLQGQARVGEFRLESVTPTTFLKPTLPQEIIDLSPAFAKIYSQASAAESAELDEIAGVGYRKALEFLVKDYCISQSPDAAEEIRAEFLGTCISNRVSDVNVKECAKRATWLGNDETHYVRRWEGKDIRDLKVLIELTVGWIRSSVLTKRYLDEMESGKS